MTFAENINRICSMRGTSLTKVIKQLKNGQSSYTTAINHKGSVPNQEDLLKLAQMLDCSVMDFFADENDATLNQDNNKGDISNNIASNDTYTTNNYYSGCDTSVINREIPITADSKEYFFRLLDKLRNMKDEHLLEMIKYADFIINRDGD